MIAMVINFHEILTKSFDKIYMWKLFGMHSNTYNRNKLTFLGHQHLWKKKNHLKRVL